MPNYTFETLSPIDFENLVRDLLQAEWGVTLESFMPGPDEGIDNRYLASEDGTTIVQSKQYARSGYDKLLAQLENEVPKVVRLAPDRYVIATSVPLSPARKRNIARLFTATEENDVYGREDLNNLLGLHPEVEKRHTALWLASSAVLEEMLDSALRPLHEGSVRAADDAEEGRDISREILNQLLAQDEVSGALRQTLERQTEPVAPLVESDRLTEAINLLTSRIEETRSLGADAGPILRDLLDRHILALRIQLGNVLARAGDYEGAAEQLSTLGDPDGIPDALVFEAARLAYSVQNADALGTLRERLAEETTEHHLATLWKLLIETDWEGVLVALDALDDYPGRAQTRARALLELGRDRARAAKILNEAWAAATRHDQRFAIAVTTADLMEAVVNREEEAPGLDREVTVAAATERLRAVAAAAPTPLLEAFARIRATQWFAFLDDRERHDAEAKAFESLDLTDAQRLRFVVDNDLDDEDLLRHVKEGAVDPAIREWIRAQRFRETGDLRREEAALWSALDGLPPGHLKDVVTERLLEVQIEAEDEAGARAILDELGLDNPLYPLFAAKVTGAFEGDAAARFALEALLADRPRCHPALRMLLGLTASAALNADGEARNHLTSRAEYIVNELAAVLPSRAPYLTLASMYVRLGHPTDAIGIFEFLESAGHRSMVLLRSKATALARAGRLPDAARTLEEAYVLDPTSVGVGTEAGRVWLEAVRFEDASHILESVVAEHADAALPRVYLAFARLNSQDDDVRKSALGTFEEALKLESALTIPPQALLAAAEAADNPVAARRYMEQLTKGARHIDVTSSDDVAEALRLAEGEQVVQGRFASRESLRAFLKHQAKQAEAFDALATSDMAPFAFIARRPWSAWLSATRSYERRDGSQDPDSYVARAPWPSAVMLRAVERGDDRQPIGPSDGLLLDLTALLTLTSIGALDEGLRAAGVVFGRIILYRDALADLRSEIQSLSSGLAWQGRQPIEATVAFLDRYGVGPHPSDPSPSALADLVPATTAQELGNSASDVGLALHLGAGFVANPSGYSTKEERAWGGHTWTSAEVLHALRRENHLGQSHAEAIAKEAPQTFGGWETTDPPPLGDLVVSGFVLSDWYASGLLDLWMQNRATWSSLRVGPFGIATLRGKVEERDARVDLLSRLRHALDILDGLLSEGVIEVLPSQPEDEEQKASTETEDNSDEVLPIWASAVALIEEAARRNLHVWADDRALGFLLWQYGTPMTGPAVDAALRRIRKRFGGTSLLSTELVLERLSGLSDRRAAELGWKLFITGYRPLLGRLALRHLLADYGPPFDGVPYNRLFSALGALHSFLPPKRILPSGRRDSYVHVATVPIFDALFDVAWNEPGLGEAERRALGDIILDSCSPLLDGASATALGLMAARLMLSMGWYREQHEGEKAAPTAEAWFGDALAERLAPGRLQAVVRAIEDMAISIYRILHDEALRDEECDDPGAQEIASRLAAQIAWQRLVPLFASRLLQVHAPVLRRILAALAGVPEAGQASRTVRRGTSVPLHVEEEEMEIAALNAFWAARDDSEYERLLGLTRVHGVWQRPFPASQWHGDEAAPDSHPVEIDVPYLTLALRDDDELREAVAAYLARGLDLVDPVLRETVKELHSSLSSDNPDKRAHAIDRLADAAIGSTALDLERDLAHAADRLRARSLDELNAWLFNPVRPEDPFDHPALSVLEDGRMPTASLSAGVLVSLEPSKLHAAVASVATNAARIVTEGEVSMDDVVTTLARHVTSHPSSFFAVYQFLVLLYVARDHPEYSVCFGNSSVPSQEWVREIIGDLLTADTSQPSLRSASLKAAHAYALRLGLHVCSDPDVLAALHAEVGEDDARLAAQWTTNVMIASDRLLAFAADRYPQHHEMAYRLREACETLGFRLDLPGRTFDRFNPMLFGPGLVDHERWLLLHALDVCWNDVVQGSLPLWWSDRADVALRYLVDHPDPHESMLLDSNVQNGLELTIGGPPSELAHRLIERATGEPHVRA